MPLAAPGEQSAAVSASCWQWRPSGLLVDDLLGLALPALHLHSLSTRIWVCPGGAYCIRCKPRVPEQVGLMVWPCPPGRAWTMMGWLVVTNWPSLTCTINGCPWTCCCICPACTIICSVELLLFAVYCSMVPPSQSPVHSQFHPGDPRTLPDVPHASLPWLAAHADWFQYQTPKLNQRLQPLLPTPLPLLRKWQSFLPKSCGCGQNYMTYYI